MALEVDYLIIGAGCSGLAFADQLFTDTDATMAIVDRRAAAGGHWCDAYPFVTLHQPSSFYGVNSQPLGAGRIDTVGWNAGLMELATGTEVLQHFQSCLRDRLVPSGRVSFLPLHDGSPDGRVRSLMTGAEIDIQVRRRVVDAASNTNSVPETHERQFTVEDSVGCVTPRRLPAVAAEHRHFVVVGGGKTAMDVCIWLLGVGAPAEAITWIVPRDSWVIDRATTQPGPAFFAESMGGFAATSEAVAAASSIEDFEDRMEAAGVWMRLDRDIRPGMFHAATLSRRELAALRGISAIVRQGRLRAAEPGLLRLEGGDVTVPQDALLIDCTASALRPSDAQGPVFTNRLITLQLLRFPFFGFSAAITAHLEAVLDTDEERNRYATPVPLCDTSAQYLQSTKITEINRFMWNSHPDLRAWVRSARLDGFGQTVAQIDRRDPQAAALFDRMRAAAVPAAANIDRLLAAS